MSRFSFRLYGNSDIGKVNNRPAVIALDNVSTVLPSGKDIIIDGVNIRVGFRVLFVNLSDPSKNNRIYEYVKQGNNFSFKEEFDLQRTSSRSEEGDCVFVHQGTNFRQKLFGFERNQWIDLKIDLDEEDDQLTTESRPQEVDLDMNSFKIVNLANGVAASDAVNVGQISGFGPGDVVGPGSSVDAELALFDGTTGKLLKGGSGITSPASNQMSFSTAGTVSVADDTTADASKAASLTIRPSNKTAGTGDGGNLILKGGTSAGGKVGIVRIPSEFDPTHNIDIFNPSVGTLFINTSDSGNHPRNTVVANGPGEAGKLQIGIGTGALQRVTSGFYNHAIGFRALWNVTTGITNIGIGVNALRDTTTHSNSVAIGTHAASTGSGSDRIAIGHAAAQLNTGSRYIAIGTVAYYNGIGGSSGTVAIGHSAGFSLTTGQRNTIIGSDALRGVTLGSRNIAIGKSAGFRAVSTSERNTIIGTDAGNVSGLSPGNFNILLGEGANVSANLASNEFILGSDTAPIHNMYLGFGSDDAIAALLMQHSDNSVADSNPAPDFTISASNKTAGTGDGGNLILQSGTSAGGSAGYVKVEGGAEPIAFYSPKAEALVIGNPGVSITATVFPGSTTVVGIDAGGTSVGESSVLLGAKTGQLGIGASNVAIGYEALRDATSASIGNTAIGMQAGRKVSGSSTQNVIIGQVAAKDREPGNGNILLGAGSEVSVALASNEMVVGSNNQKIATIYLGRGTHDALTDNLLMKHSDASTADAVAAPSFTISASSKTAGTGDGGHLKLSGGTSVGGVEGEIQANSVFTLDHNATPIYFSNPSINSLNISSAKITSGMSESVVIGVGAGTSFANNSVCIGHLAGGSQTGGSVSNVYIGADAGRLSTSALANVFIGRGAGEGNITGNGNIAIGNSAGGIALGQANIIFGSGADVPAAGNSNYFILGSDSAPILTALLGTGSDEVGTNALLMQHSNSVAVNAVAAPNFTIQASSKTGGGSTGNGGNLILKGGTSVGGAAGIVQISSAALFDSSVEIDGDLNHDGSNVGFYGQIPATQPTDLGALTDSTGGTADGTVAAVSGSGADATINDNFKELLDKYNGLRDRLRTLGLMA